MIGDEPRLLLQMIFFSLSLSLWADPKETVQIEEKPVPPSSGLLVAEPYSWKSLVTGQPILRIRSTGTRAAVLILPPGYVQRRQGYL